MMRRWGIRKKVLVLALAPTATITLAIGLFFTHSWVTNIGQLLEDRGESLSRQLAAASEYGMSTGNRSLLFGLASAMLEEQDVRSVTLYAPDGAELVHTGPRVSVRRPREFPTETWALSGDEASLYLTPIVLQDLIANNPTDREDRRAGTPSAEALGWAAVELSHTSMIKERYKALLISLLLIFGGILVNTLIALRMSRTVIDPIFELNRAVARLKEGKFDSRVYIDAGPELVELESGLNDMAAALSKAHAEMQQNVDQATEDLRETLETIEIQNIELDLARKEALEASRIKSEFLANMSHEIRTPLNGIIGFTDILLKGALGQQQREHLTTIRKSSEILLTIINDILDFSKIEAGKLILDRIPFRLREIVEEVMVMLAPAAHAKNLDLVPLIYSDVPDNIVGDPLRIKQIITNLINNAIKFTQSGEVVLRAMLDDDDEQQVRVRLSVSDTGVGLSRAQQQALFHAFSQADASTARHYGGTGLGLVISRRLVEEMGGEIGLESELGKGSSFWFTLATEVAVNSEPPHPQDALRGERVIYLEHQATTGLAVEHLLTDWGIPFDRVASPTEMAERVAAAQDSQRGYAVALLGLHRHLLNSAQYRELIHQLEVERDCRVLLMTPTLEENETPFAALASTHMIKPLCRDKLYAALFRLIHGDEPTEDEPQAPFQIRDLQHSEIRPLHILAVDDNEANLKLVLTLLDDLNLRSDGAGSGFEALGLVKQQRYDLIFMDVQIPGMDGVETTRRIRAMEPRGQHLPIIALTAHALTEERSRLLGSGFDAYLTKPIDTNQLIDCISRHTGYTVPRQSTSGHALSETKAGASIRPSTRHRQARAVDIEASIRLAAGKPDLAEELFSMLIEHLIHDENQIRAHWLASERGPLLECVHKLHGAARYCGVPELRDCAQTLETALKQNSDDVDEGVKRLLNAIERIQRWCEQTDWQQQFRQSPSLSSL
jgi:two-component system sensor histidine kinase BarA